MSDVYGDPPEWVKLNVSAALTFTNFVAHGGETVYVRLDYGPASYWDARLLPPGFPFDVSLAPGVQQVWTGHVLVPADFVGIARQSIRFSYQRTRRFSRRLHHDTIELAAGSFVFEPGWLRQGVALPEINLTDVVWTLREVSA